MGSAQLIREPDRTVSSVTFTGNHAIDSYTLSIAIATTQSTWTYRVPILKSLGLGTRRLFNELEFRRDVLRLQLFYRQNGYYEAHIDTAVARAARTVRVTFRIREGPSVLVDSITISGLDSTIPARPLLRRLPLTLGRPLSRLLFDLSGDTLLFALRDQGYPFAAVFRNYTVDLAAHRARVTYEVVPGPKARVGAISIEGSQGVPAATVRRFLSMREGDPFRQSTLYDSQHALYQSNMFRYAAVGIAPESTVGGVDSLVRLRVQVAEGRLVQVKIGAGYGTIDCFRTQVTGSVANFLGGARRLDASGRVSKIGVGAPTHAMGLDRTLCSALAPDPFSDTLNYATSLTLTQPALFSRPMQASVSGFAERRSEFRAYENISIGTSLALALGAVVPAPVTITYRLAESRTNADAATFCMSFDRCEASTIQLLGARRRQGSVSVALSQVRVNSRFNPTQGHILSLEVMSAARALYSQVVFDKVTAEATWYRLLTRGWGLALRVRAGAIRTGLSSVADSAIRFVPPDVRFYMGGPTTVRGYGRNAMGPVVFVTTDPASVTVDPGTGLVTRCDHCRTSPLGSSAVALANAELRMPSPVWSTRIGLAAFVDVGEVWAQAGATGLVPNGVRVTPGGGLRFITPLGSMRMDIAYNGYPPNCGLVYLATGGTLTRQGTAEFCPARQTGFLQRLQYHFSVGQAF